MQQGDYSSSYYQYHHPPHLQNPNPNPNSIPPNPNPNPIDYQSSTYASAPPFAPNYSSSSSDYSSNYQQQQPGYPPYLSNSDHLPQIPPTAPSYQQPNPPNYQSFNPPPPPPHQPSSFNSVPEQQPPPSLPYSAPPQQQSPYYPSYDHHQPTNYPPTNSNPIPTSNPNPSFSSSYPNSYTQPSVYESSYDTNLKFDRYLDDSTNRYGVQPSIGRSHSEPAVDFYEKRPESGHSLYGRSSHIQEDDVRGQNIYPYEGGKVEPYGARGTGKSSNFSAAFDDYGRSLSLSAKDQVGLNKVLKAVPKVETQQDVKNGVQKFRVKLLAETGGQTPMDVLCQIGLDGIRMLDPSSARTLRIYPLETITRSEVLDSSIFAFWSKSTVDIEPRRIRLKSNSYTTNTILDTVTAATIQLKEIGGKDSFSSRQLDPSKQSEQYTEKKKGFTDWVNLIKPGNEEKDHWVPDEAVTKCTACGTDFGAFVRRHHCRNCGDIFCDKCTHGRIALTAEENAQPVRVCDRCLAEVTQRLSNAKETASKPAALCSHEDLAKKLQEEMDKNRKTASASKSSDGSGRRMREVACPTCTVHLQVQVPTSGSETIECGVCQHPFLVSAH